MSVPNRQKPPVNLKGIDPNYHPCGSENGWWDKDAMLNNCSIAMLSGIEGIEKWDKFFEYFWHNKGEAQDLQTPGAMVVTLSISQRSTIRLALKQGFEPVCYFPSCHGGNHAIVMMVKNNEVMMKNQRVQFELEKFKKEIEGYKKDIKIERENAKAEPVVEVAVEAAPKPKRKPKPRVYADVMEDNL